MKTISLGNANISFIDENIVLFEAAAEAIIDKKAVQYFYNEIEQHVDGNYSLVINRKNKYQLLRIEVFNVINNQSRLMGLAIVAAKDSARKMAEIEISLCQKPFAIFSNINDAVT